MWYYFILKIYRIKRINIEFVYLLNCKLNALRQAIKGLE